MQFELENLRTTKIRRIFKGNISERIRAQRNDRIYPALMFKLEGKTNYICDGKEYLADDRHVIILPKNKPYVYDILETGTSISIEFESDTDIDCLYSYKITDNTKVRSILSDMVQLWSSKSGGYKLALYSSFYELLHTIYVLSNVDYNVEKKESALRPAVSYIQEHYGEIGITNEALAEISGMSTVYFRKLFTKRYGLSPMKYISNIRIENAKNLLLEGNLSTSEIAEAVGFSSVYSFSRAFKNATEISPTEFIKKNKNFSL